MPDRLALEQAAGVELPVDGVVWNVRAPLEDQRQRIPGGHVVQCDVEEAVPVVEEVSPQLLLFHARDALTICAN